MAATEKLWAGQALDYLPQWIRGTTLLVTVLAAPVRRWPLCGGFAGPLSRSTPTPR